jgi:ADP-ribose pyrophosphatase YjhB (NUDIX family)
MKINDTYLKCLSCSLHFYSNPKPCTALILTNENNEYLLVKRAVDPRKGFWDLPGGFIEDNENFETGVRREAKEEIGIDIGELTYFGSYYDNYLYQDVSYTTLAVSFTARVPKGAVLKPDDDVESYQYFKLEDIPFKDLAFDSMRTTFKHLVEQQKAA